MMKEMSDDKSIVWYQEHWRFLLIILLIIILSAVSILVIRRPSRSQEIIIATEVPSVQKVEISVSGQVENPGIYLVNDSDTIGDIVAMAGGDTTGDYSDVIINLSPTISDVSEESQKININTAAEWLLDALPGIGSERAEAIIAYREQNGDFLYVEELMQVPGIGEATFEALKDYIKVAD